MMFPTMPLARGRGSAATCTCTCGDGDGDGDGCPNTIPPPSTSAAPLSSSSAAPSQKPPRRLTEDVDDDDDDVNGVDHSSSEPPAPDRGGVVGVPFIRSRTGTAAAAKKSAEEELTVHPSFAAAAVAHSLAALSFDTSNGSGPSSAADDPLHRPQPQPTAPRQPPTAPPAPPERTEPQAAQQPAQQAAQQEEGMVTYIFKTPRGRTALARVARTAPYDEFVRTLLEAAARRDEYTVSQGLGGTSTCAPIGDAKITTGKTTDGRSEGKASKASDAGKGKRGGVWGGGGIGTSGLGSGILPLKSVAGGGRSSSSPGGSGCPGGSSSKSPAVPPLLARSVSNSPVLSVSSSVLSVSSSAASAYASTAAYAAAADAADAADPFRSATRRSSEQRRATKRTSQTLTWDDAGEDGSFDQTNNGYSHEGNRGRIGQQQEEKGDPKPSARRVDPPGVKVQGGEFVPEEEGGGGGGMRGRRRAVTPDMDAFLVQATRMDLGELDRSARRDHRVQEDVNNGANDGNQPTQRRPANERRVRRKSSLLTRDSSNGSGMGTTDGRSSSRSSTPGDASGSFRLKGLPAPAPSPSPPVVSPHLHPKNGGATNINANNSSSPSLMEVEYTDHRSHQDQPDHQQERQQDKSTRTINATASAYFVRGSKSFGREEYEEMNSATSHLPPQDQGQGPGFGSQDHKEVFLTLHLRLLGGTDRQNRVGSKFGGGGMASSANSERDRKERQRQLALESVDLAKDPYLMRNHLGSYECKLCLTLHTNEANYLAHTQGKKHQAGLAKRAAMEKKRQRLQGMAGTGPMPQTQAGVGASAATQRAKRIRIGRPGYEITKSRDPKTNQRCLTFYLHYPEVDADEVQPRHRFMSAFEQRVESPPDRRYQYLLVACDPYETVAFKIPNEPIDRGEGRFVTNWDAEEKRFTLTLYLMEPSKEAAKVEAKQ